MYVIVFARLSQEFSYSHSISPSTVTEDLVLPSLCIVAPGARVGLAPPYACHCHDYTAGTTRYCSKYCFEIV